MSKKNVTFTVPYKHLKTGKTYYAVNSVVINATNSQTGDSEMILYTDGNLLFAREATEFKQKFEKL